MAGDVQYIVKRNINKLANNGVLQISSPTTAIAGNHTVQTQTAVAALVYGREQRSDVAGAVWDYTVHYQLIDVNNGGTVRVGVVNIANDNAEGIYESVGVHEDVSDRVRLEVTQIVSNGSVPEDIRLELRLNIKRYEFLNHFTKILLEVEAGTAAGVKAEQAQARWPYFDGAEYYELEWAYWDKENDNQNPTEQEIFEQAVRVETNNNYYVMDLVYPEGTVYFRVRPVGRFVLGVNGNYEHLKYGAWSEYLIGTQVDAVSANFEQSRNWQFTRSFAEDGKHKEVINYFDDGLKSRMTLTNLNSEHTTLVAEQVYDAENRPTLSILPVPVENKAMTDNPLKFGAVSNNLIGTGGVQYDRTNFDRNSVGVTFRAAALPSNHIASEYYSANNPFLSGSRPNIAYTPNSEYTNNLGQTEYYPIAQVEYLNDGTGRMKRQSGVGSFYQLGSGHETKYHYSNPTNTELRRLFGSNVGDSKHYRKNIVIDANGQQSVAYIDQAGQTIATALSGVSPENVQPLGGNTAPFVNDLMGSNEKSAVSRTSTVVHQLFCDAPSKAHNFEYELLEGKSLTDGADFCESCTYKVSFTVEDESGNRIGLGPIQGFTSSGVSLELSEDISNVDPCTGDDYQPNTVFKFFTTFPSIGTYTVRKILTVTGPNLDDVADAAKAGGSLIDQNTFIQNYIVANFDSTECEPCNDAFRRELCSDLVRLMHPTVDETSTTFDSLVDVCMANYTDCDELLLELSLTDYYSQHRDCAAMLEQMKRQLSPGGCLYDNGYYQAVWDHDDITNYSFQPLTVTTTTFGGNGPSYTIDDQTDIDVISDPANWEDNWADVLVEWHPDYPRYLECMNRPSVESKIFDHELAAIELWSEANTTYNITGTSDLARIQGIIAADPYFVNHPSLATQMENALLNYCTTMQSANPAGSTTGQPAVDCSCGANPQSVFCYIDNNLDPPTTNPNVGNPNYSSGSTQPLTDKELWEIFRGIYANEKIKIVYEQLDINVIRQVPIDDQGTLFTVPVGVECPEIGGEPQVTLDDGSTIGMTGLNSTSAMQGAVYTQLGVGAAVPPAGAPCDVICENNARTWINLICPDLENQGALTTEYDAIKAAFKEYCLEGCGDPASGNPLGYLLQFDLDAVVTPTAITPTSTPLEKVKYYFANLPLLPPNNFQVCDPVVWDDLITTNISVNQDEVYCPTTSYHTPVTTNVSIDKCNRIVQLLTAMHSAGVFPTQWTSSSASFTGFLHDPANYPPYASNDLLGTMDYAQLNLSNLGSTNLASVASAIGSANSPITGVTLNNGYSFETPLTNTSELEGIDRFIRFTGTFLGNRTGCADNGNYSSFGMEFVLATGEAINPFEIVSIDPASYDCNSNSLNLIVVDQPCNWSAALPIGSPCSGAATKVVRAYIRLEFNTPCLPAWETSGNNTVFAKTNTVTINHSLGQVQCWQQQYNILAAQAVNAYANYVEETLTNLIQNDNCLAVTEAFSVSYDNTEQHYTLYYYDEAGNLIQTYPPEAVKPVELSHFDLPAAPKKGVWDGTEPEHNQDLATQYQYNTLGQVVESKTPDAGTTRFWHDYAQRLRLSQSARYTASNQHAYTKYDKQGRVIEVGRLDGYTVNPVDLNCRSFPDFPIDQPTAPTYRSERIVTEYDELSFKPTNFDVPQNNLRGRVSRMYNDECVSYFDYDIHGNVKTLHQQIRNFGAVSIEYDYDLITGNVNEVAFMPGTAEQFYHRYRYDEDNRITRVETSENRHVWETDARYFYYPHGPLARCEKGHDKVDGADFYYTLQGWIKGVNNTTTDTDMGRDGFIGNPTLRNPNQWFSKDQCAYQLGYHKKDYTAIGAASSTSPLLGLLDINSTTAFDGDILNDAQDTEGLYNGNIAYMITHIPALATQTSAAETQAMVYQYDALHRIKQAKSYVPTTGTWNANGQFDTDYTYDANGNIKTLNRKAQGQLIDQLGYIYNSTKINRLERVTELAPAHSLGVIGDLEDQTDLLNYKYDASGNLISDTSEDIVEIKWNFQNKVESVTYTSTSGRNNLRYTYDGSGNRLSKTVIEANGLERSTVYIRDASGNIMATYEVLNTAVNAPVDLGTGGPQLAVQNPTPIDLQSMSAAQIEQVIAGVPQQELPTICTQTVNAAPQEVLNALPATSTVTTASPTLLEQELMAMPQQQAVSVMATAISNMNTAQLASLSSLSTFYAKRLREKVLYGSDRLGIKNYDPVWYNYTLITTEPAQMSENLRILNRSNWTEGATRGDKLYEGKNHLGNVLATCSDKKLGTDTNGDGIADFYTAQVQSAQDYYAFGWNMPGRQYSSGNYRFGFNGMEYDKNIGEGNYTTLYRILDTRIGRWLSVDPEAAHFTSETPYSLSLNNPIAMSDPNGDCPTGDCDDETTPTGGSISVPSGSVTGYATTEGMQGTVISFKSGKGEFFWDANSETYISGSNVTYSESDFVFPELGESRHARLAAREANMFLQSGIPVSINNTPDGGLEVVGGENIDAGQLGSRFTFHPSDYPEVGTVGAMTPVYGNTMSAYYNLEDGDYLRAGINVTLAGIDGFTFGAIGLALGYKAYQLSRTRTLYEIGDGVRRAKAAQLIPWKRSIKVTDHTGKVFKVRIKDLRSPMKSQIDISSPAKLDRYKRAADYVRKGQNYPIYVNPGNRGIPIRKITFKK